MNALHIFLYQRLLYREQVVNTELISLQIVAVSISKRSNCHASGGRIARALASNKKVSHEIRETFNY